MSSTHLSGEGDTPPLSQTLHWGPYTCPSISTPPPPPKAQGGRTGASHIDSILGHISHDDVGVLLPLFCGEREGGGMRQG